MEKNIFQANRTFLMIVLFSVIFIGSAASGILPMGIPGQWVFPHIGEISKYSFPWMEISAGFAVALVMIFLALSSGKDAFISKKTIFWRFALIVFAGLFFDFAVLSSGRVGLSENIFAIFDDYASGYYEEAVKIDRLGNYMQDFHAKQQNVKFINHKSVHPPGRILLSYFTYQAVRNSPALERIILDTMPCDAEKAFAAIEEDDLFPFVEMTSEVKAGALLHIYLFLFLISLGKISIFIAILLLFNPVTALRNAALFMFVPSPILFLPHYDCFLGAFSAGLMLMAIIAVRMKKLSFWLVSFCGVYSCCCVLFSMAFGVPALWIMIFWFLSSFHDGRPDSSVFLKKYVLPYAAGIVAVLLFLQILFQFPMAPVILKCLENNEQFFQNQSTRTLIWKLLNPVEFFVGAGFPVMILILSYLTFSWRTLWSMIRGGSLMNPNPVIAASVLILAFLILTPTRAEVSRQWSCAWPAVYLLLPYILESYGDKMRKIMAAVAIAMVLQILLFRFFIKIVIIEN